MSFNIPYSKWKNLSITAQSELTKAEMDKIKEAAWNTDWERIIPEKGLDLITRMNFKESDMDRLIGDLEKVATLCSFLSFTGEFTHDYFDSEDMIDVEDVHICTVTVAGGKVQY